MKKIEQGIRSLSPTLLWLLPAMAAAQAEQTEPPAVPASQSVPAKAAKADGVNTVVVSATRRREPVREVPMQIDTITSDQLERSGAASLREYMEMQPGIVVNSKGSGSQGDISIRGMTTGSQITNTVGIYLDDTAVTASGAASSAVSFPLDLGLLDLHHIEVLRGPQGTLYGAGSMGGVLKYVTNMPDVDTFSGTVKFGLSHGTEGGIGTTLGAVLNTPLKQGVMALRMAVLQDRPAGYVRAIGPAGADRADRGRTTGARVALGISPGNGLEITASATTQKMHRDGIDLVDYDPVTRVPAFGALTQQIFQPQPIDKHDDLYSVNVEYKLGGTRLNSITSEARSRMFRQADATAITVGYVPFPAETAVDLQWLDVHKFTQEFRATSDKGEHFDWLGGVFYTREGASNDQRGTCRQAAGACPLLYDVALPSSYRELSAYGDLTWHVTPAFAVTGGVRVAHNRQSFAQISSGFYYGSDTPDAVGTTSSDSSRTWLLTGQYALSKTSNLYARYATAYRPGGPNAVVPGAALSSTFQPDTSKNYEIGYKADLLDKRLSVQADAYWIDWQNVQQSYSLGGASGVINAGAARIRGGELVVNYKPRDGWVAGASVALIDAKLTEDAPGLGAHAGDRMPTSPRLSAAASLRYDFDLRGRAANIGLTGRYVGDRLVRFYTNDPLLNVRMPGYAVFNLEGGIDMDKYQVNLYVRNLFNRAGIASGTTSMVPLGGPLQFTLEQPRAVGVQLTASF